jgi:hypothetical protein
MNRTILCQEKDIKVLQVAETLPNIFNVVIRGMIGIQINVFAVCLFTREQESNR